MPTFKFDESKPIDDNIESYFTHLESYDQEFAGHLKANLTAAVGEDFDRATFNATVAELLDREADSQES